MLRATTAGTFSSSQLPKVVRGWRALYILTWKCASRHNGVQLPKVVRTGFFLYILTWKCASRHNGLQLFIISTSKSSPRLACFVHFDLDMRLPPQRRALFHLSSGQLAPPEPQIIRKTHAGLRDFSAFSGTWIIFLLRFSLF